MAWWRSEDEGRTWRPARRVTSDSAFNHAYARRPLHVREPFVGFWADGDPRTFGPSRLYFTDGRGERVWRLPDPMSDERQVPERWPPGR